MIFSTSFKALIISLLFVSSTVSVHAEKQTTEHGHDQGGENIGMVLNDGKKWDTDAPLRKGMQSIHDIVNGAEKDFQTKTMTQEEGKALGSKINKQLMYMVENCELQPKADASLHVVIGEMMQGIGELSKDQHSVDGFPRIHNALKQYPKFFDHPELD